VPPQVSAQPQINVVHPLPPITPAWLEGYQVRWPVRILGEPVAQDAKTVIVSLPTGGWLRPDASDLAVQSASGVLLPMAVLSHDPLGETIIQFKRNGNDPWYWVYGINPKGGAAPKTDAKTDPLFREGVTLELRDWVGDDLSSWVKVRAGLEKSTTVIGNAIVGEVIQNCNPARPDQSTKFAASYRGFFNVKKDGTYSFVVNAEDAAFLFIDGFKVFERPGNNRPLGTVKVKELEKIAGKVELKAGVHAFEVHHAMSDNPGSTGRCALVWTTPEQPKFNYVLPPVIAHPLYARVAATQRADGDSGGTFVHGIYDTLEASGLKLVLMRFEAEPTEKDAKHVWDFGDGTTGVGRSVMHVYFKDGDYTVTLTTNNATPFKRRVRVWPEPGETSPLSLDLTVKTLAGMEWKKLDVSRIREIFTFLQICEQPGRFAYLDEVAQHLLAMKDFDLETRSQLYTARMESLVQLGKAAEALKLAEQAKPEFVKTPALQVRLQLGTAAIYQYHYKDGAAASKIYKAILDEHSRTEHPNLRLAGIRWGDLFAEAGDLAKASETYRIAATLGGEKFSSTSQTDATTRGALLRIAEQKLKGGEILQTRQLLEKIELEYPGRRLDGLYCFLRAESDRFAGRYEESLRYYEMIFKLPQWAGYRDRATFGIADSYLRMGELEKSLKWFANLKEAHPKFHEAQKIAEVEKLIESRLERVKKGKAEDAVFQGFGTGFEPEETEWFGDPQYMAAVRSPSIEGRHALLMDIYPRELSGAEFNYVRPLKNLIPGGTYWVEIWYRDLYKPSPPAMHQQPFLHTRLIAETPAKTEFLAGGNILRNSHHQWHKLSFKMKAPLAQDFQLKITFSNITGAMLFDALSIRPVTDRQLDALTNFLEGGKGP